jgi:hypothetical protein
MSLDSDRQDAYGPRNSDPGAASAARVYNYLLGGQYNYDRDRVAAASILREFPLTASLARYNRAWVQRAVRYLVDQGVRQFLDIGSGIPDTGNVHEIAQSVIPSARVVYVDYEKVAIDLGKEILATNPFAGSVHADMRLPETVLDHPVTREILDFDQPIAMIWGSMLHFIEDQDDPFSIFAAYKNLLKPGDYVALSHITEHFLTDRPLEQIRNFITAYNANVAQNLTLRPMDQIDRFFEGSELAEPGVVPLPDWHPDDPDYEPDQTDAARGVLVGGVGRLS